VEKAREKMKKIVVDGCKSLLFKLGVGNVLGF
jgi:hypothetical protein